MFWKAMGVRVKSHFFTQAIFMAASADACALHDTVRDSDLGRAQQLLTTQTRRGKGATYVRLHNELKAV